MAAEISIGTTRIPLKFKTPEDEERFGIAMERLASRLDSAPGGQMLLSDAISSLADELNALKDSKGP